MATPPPRPPSRRPTPGGRPGQPAAARPGTQGRQAPGTPGARAGAPGGVGARPRKAERIRYTPARIEESKWGRKALIGLVAVAVVVGTIGWYRYLMRPPVAVRLPVAAPAADAPERPEAPAPAAASASPAPVERGPITLLPRELAAELAVERELTPAQAFHRRYRGREVTWSGTVTAVTRIGHDLKVDFTDSDRMKVAAWCRTDAQVSPGLVVTVRGKLANRLKDGFSVGRCQLL